MWFVVGRSRRHLGSILGSGAAIPYADHEMTSLIHVGAYASGMLYAGDLNSTLVFQTSNPTLPVKTLSGGNQQRVVLAKWLASKPKVMILNGPTVGVDVGSKDELHGLMKELASEGMGLLVISDDIPELLQTCNRILLMRHGRIVQEIRSKDTNENELSSKLIED